MTFVQKSPTLVLGHPNVEKGLNVSMGKGRGVPLEQQEGHAKQNCLVKV